MSATATQQELDMFAREAAPFLLAAPSKPLPEPFLREE